VRRRSVRFSNAARERLGRLGQQRERRILWEVKLASASVGSRRLFQVRAGHDVVACELVDEGETVLVYAIETREQMLARLLGDEITRVSERRRSRLLHWRFY
jgi:mRNA-degrading endonuclease RelE of RelBE toxin-antitoxin system